MIYVPVKTSVLVGLILRYLPGDDFFPVVIHPAIVSQSNLQNQKSFNKSWHHSEHC